MKTCALYGFMSALGGAFLTLILFFTGFHSDPAKLTAATWVGGLGGLGIAVICIVLGMKARREEVPVNQEFGYGAALGAGFLISVFASVLNAIFTYIYYSFINPALLDIILQDKMAKLEASGASADRLEKTQAGMKMLMGPVPQAISVVIGGIIIGVIISLIVAAILRRPTPPKVPA